MPGARTGDGRSPSTLGISGHYTGEILQDSKAGGGGGGGNGKEVIIPHGEGKMVWSNGISYDGGWKDGVFHGHGTKIHPNGGGYTGSYISGLRNGTGTYLYGGKWGYNKWVGPFKNNKANGDGILHLEGKDETLNFTFRNDELIGDPPCNYEYEKSVFFRRLDPTTTDETMRLKLEVFGPLDYCYIARDMEGNSMRIGRAKFRPVAVSDNQQGHDEKGNKVWRIWQARQKAVDNAKAAGLGLDGVEIDGQVIKIEIARPVDYKEWIRYGDY